MISVLYILIAPIVFILIIALAWRFASRRYTIPCPVWMKGLLDTPHAGGMSARTRKTIQHLDLRAGMKVLDAGCGPGRLTIPVVQIVGPCGEVTAVDLQEGMLSEARNGRMPHTSRTSGFSLRVSGTGSLSLTGSTGPC